MAGLAHVCALAVLAGCVPSHASYLSVPVVPDDAAPHDDAVLWVPLAELASRMDDFQVDRLAFFAHGREPLPFRTIDTDGDGRADTAAVAMTVRGDGSSHLIVVSPGPAADGEAPDAPATAGVVLDFEHARR